MKSYQKNILLFLSGIAALIIAFLTMRGTIQNYISFAGVANEIAFTFLLTLYGISSIFAGTPSRLWKNLRKKLFPYVLSFQSPIKFNKKYHPTGMTMKTWNKKFRNRANH